MTTSGGTQYVRLRIAVVRSKRQTDFFTVELWGRLGGVALKHAAVGRMVSLRCQLRQETWTVEGERRERVSLVVRKFGLLTSEGKTHELDDEDDQLDEAA